MKGLFIFIVATTLFIYACSSNPYRQTNKVYKEQARGFAKEIKELPPVYLSGKPAAYPVGTINFNLRKPNYVIIHHTAQEACERTLRTFTVTHSQVSAHYVICKDGTIHHMLNDYLRAWHAGAAKWGSLTDINSASIGIEIDNNGKEPFTDAQIDNLILLLDKLKKDYSIPGANFIGHSDIAPIRKQDPSAFFPWQKLAEYGFGNWPDIILEPVPPGFNNIQALRLIGYDTRDSIAAIRAFKLHFIQSDRSPLINTHDREVLYNLVRKY